MSRWLLILTLASVLNAGKKENGSNLAEKNRKSESTPSVSFVNNENACPDKKASDTEPPHWYASPEWWLCILGIPTLFFIGWQAEATKVAAEAASLSAQAVINVERPWLLENIAREGDVWMVSLRNAGNTPADVADGYWCFSTMANDFKMPQNFQRHPFVIQKTLLVKGDSLESPTFDTNAIKLQAFNGFRDTGAIDRDFKFLYWHGEIEYWDTFTDRTAPGANPHKTQWCYVYNPTTEEFIRAPCDYHQHT